MDKIVLKGEGEELALFVLDSTKLAGVNYLLVSDQEQGDGECYVLEELPSPHKDILEYKMVEDDMLLDQLANIFGEQLEDLDIEF